MTVSVKVECECGQRYVFDVEPVNGRVPAPVACPACGADGTAPANAFLAHHYLEKPTARVADGSPLRVGLPGTQAQSGAPAEPVRVTARPGGALLPGQVSRSQAQHEARAKMLWGDPPLQVLGYLLSQGFSREEAAEIVRECQQERLMTIRGNGIKYTVIGSSLLFVPLLGFINYLITNRIRPKSLALMVIVGGIAVVLLVKGIFMLVSPKSKSGDATDDGSEDSWFD